MVNIPLILLVLLILICYYLYSYVTTITTNIVSSLDKVTNDGRDINLVTDANITITPDDIKITISTTGGTSGSGDGYSLDVADSLPTDTLCVDNSGNVSIGTTRPVNKWHVSGSTLNLYYDNGINAGDYVLYLF